MSATTTRSLYLTSRIPFNAHNRLTSCSSQTFEMNQVSMDFACIGKKATRNEALSQDQIVKPPQQSYLSKTKYPQVKSYRQRQQRQYSLELSSQIFTGERIQSPTKMTNNKSELILIANSIQNASPLTQAKCNDTPWETRRRAFGKTEPSKTQYQNVTEKILAKKAPTALVSSSSHRWNKATRDHIYINDSSSEQVQQQRSMSVQGSKFGRNSDLDMRDIISGNLSLFLGRSQSDKFQTGSLTIDYQNQLEDLPNQFIRSASKRDERSHPSYPSVFKFEVKDDGINFTKKKLQDTRSSLLASRNKQKRCVTDLLVSGHTNSERIDCELFVSNYVDRFQHSNNSLQATNMSMLQRTPNKLMIGRYKQAITNKKEPAQVAIHSRQQLLRTLADINNQTFISSFILNQSALPNSTNLNQ